MDILPDFKSIIYSTNERLDYDAIAEELERKTKPLSEEDKALLKEIFGDKDDKRKK